jgi:putative endonuclease
MRRSPCVYLLASGRNGTLYVGVTSDIVGRVSLHKQDLIDGFSKRFGVHRLVYVEFCATMEQAIAREKQVKRWRRADEVVVALTRDDRRKLVPASPRPPTLASPLPLTGRGKLERLCGAGAVPG